MDLSQSSQTIYLGGDNQGHALKQLLKEFLKEKGIAFVDLGKFENDATEFAIIKRELDEKLAMEKNPMGILIFGKQELAPVPAKVVGKKV